VGEACRSSGQPYLFVPAFAGVAGCATPTGSAGHAGAPPDLRPTFHRNTQRGLISAVSNTEPATERAIDDVGRLGEPYAQAAAPIQIEALAREESSTQEVNRLHLSNYKKDG
jgi:hypothetical protein